MPGSGQDGCNIYLVFEDRPLMHSCKGHKLGRRVSFPMQIGVLQAQVERATG